MKIREILTEAELSPYSRAAINHQTLHDVTKILEEKCPEALRTMKTEPLWRGSNSNTTDILTLDPSVGARVSQNTTNYYTLLMEQLMQFFRVEMLKSRYVQEWIYGKQCLTQVN